ncbi:MAG: glycosyltransferase family 4 protein [Thiogranum sp.]
MLKVLSIHWGLSIGGVGKYAALIEQAEQYAEVEVHSLCILSRNRQVDESTLEALRHKTVLWRDSARDFRWVERAVAFMQSWQPDLVMSHGFNGHFMSSILRRKAAVTVPAICSYHGEYHATTPLRHLTGFFYTRYTHRYIRKKVLSVVAVAEYCGKFLSDHGVDPAKITVIHNGIEDGEPVSDGREELRGEWGVGCDDVLVGVASRVDPVKGIRYLVDAFWEISGRHPGARLVIVGTGTLDKELKENVDKCGLSGRVIFAGFRTDIDRCFAAFDIFALPSLAEYHSIGLLEAMRAGKPIIATSVGGNTESVRDGEEAL